MKNLNIRGQGPSNGPFQGRGPLKFRHFIIFFVNLGPSRNIAGQTANFLVLGRGVTLGPWKPPPLWPNPTGCFTRNAIFWKFVKNRET